MNNNASKFLNEIKVLDFTNHYSGDLASMFFSDFGASVTKFVTKNKTNFQSDLFWNRNKKIIKYSNTNNLSKLEIIKLINQSDVLIYDSQLNSNEYKSILSNIEKANNTNLIICHISAFPDNSEFKNEPMIDELVIARAGEMMILPGLGKPSPKFLMHPIASVGCGINTATAIIAALISNMISIKQINNINSTLLGGLLLYASNPYQGDKWRDFGKPYGGAPFYSNYECADGFIQLACIGSKFAQNAAIAIDIPEVIIAPEFESIFYRPVKRDKENYINTASKLYDLIAIRMKNKTCSEWSKIFENADVPYNKINNIEETINDEQILHNKLIFEKNNKKRIGKFIKINSNNSNTNSSKIIKRKSFTLPLEGFKSIEITNIIAGPVAGRILSNLGVEAVKLEPPIGEISRPLDLGYFKNLNRNKKGISVDAKTDQGKKIIKKLVQNVDIFLENMRPGAADRVGLSAKDLNKLNPTIIQTHIAAYGHDGSYVHRPGLDPIAQSITALQHIQGGGVKPVFLPMLAPTDFTAGGMAALGTIVSLYNKIKNGTGSTVHTNLLAGGMLLNGKTISNYLINKHIPKFINENQNGISDFNRAYKCKDQWIYIYCNKIPDKEIIDLINKKFNLTINNSSDIEKLFLSYNSTDIIRILSTPDIYICLVTNPKEDNYDFLVNPITLKMITNKDYHPSLISLEMAHNMYDLGLKNKKIINCPELGEHNNKFMKQLGYTEEDITKMYKKKIIFKD